MGLLGFTSLYREGFEVVLFLQSYYLRMGGKAVLLGALLGLFFTGIVAVLTFVAHRKLPYRKMLILTGVMLGGVLLVMVGEQAQEMQLAHWIPTTPIIRLENVIPAWMGLWFSVFRDARNFDRSTACRHHRHRFLLSRPAHHLAALPYRNPVDLATPQIVR